MRVYSKDTDAAWELESVQEGRDILGGSEVGVNTRWRRQHMHPGHRRGRALWWEWRYWHRRPGPLKQSGTGRMEGEEALKLLIYCLFVVSSRPWVLRLSSSKVKDQVSLKSYLSEHSSQRRSKIKCTHFEDGGVEAQGGWKSCQRFEGCWLHSN